MDFSFQIFMKLIFFTFPLFLFTQAQQVNFGLCANPECSVPVGYGHTLQRYSASEHFKLSFSPNEKVEIIVKDAGQKKELYGVLKGGKKGYVPKNLVREDQTYISIKELVPAKIDFLHSFVASNDATFQAHSSSHMSHAESQSWPSENYGAHRMEEEQSYNFVPSSISQYSESMDSDSQLHMQDYSHPSSNSLHSKFSDQYTTNGIQNTYDNVNFEHSGQYNYETNNVPPSIPTNAMFHGNGQQQPYIQPSDNIEYNSAMQNSPHLTSFASQINGIVDSPNLYIPGTGANYQGSNIQNTHASTFFGQESGLENTHVTNTHSGAVLPSQAPGMQPSFDSHSHSIQASVANIKSNVKEDFDEDLAYTLALLQDHGASIDSLTELYGTEKQNAQVKQSSSQTTDSTSTGDTSYGHESSSQFQSVQTKNDEIASQVQSAFHSSVDTEGRIAYSSEANNIGTGYSHDALSTSSKVSDNMLFEGNNGENNLDAHSENDYEEEDEEEDDDEVEIEADEDISVNLQETNAEKQEIASDLSNDLLAKKENFIKSENDLAESQKNSPNSYLFEKPKVQNVDGQESISESSQFVNKEGTPASKVLPPLSGEESLDKVKISKPSTDTFDKNSPTYTQEENVTYKNDTNSIASDLPVITERINDSNENSESVDVVSKTNISESSDVINANAILPDISIHSTIEIEHSKSVAFSHHETEETDNTNATDSELSIGQESELDKILNISELSESEKVGYLNPYQIRNLKEENGMKENENIELDEVVEETNTYAEFNLYETLENILDAIRAFIKLIMPWVPEPLYSVLMDLHSKGISPRVPVFTTIISIPCVFLIIAVVYIREKSKEKELIAQLALSEKNVYVLSAEKHILEDKIEKATVELQASNLSLDEERSTFEELKTEIRNLKEDIEKANLELERKSEEIGNLKEREKQYVELVSDYEKTHAILMEEKNEVEQKVLDIENTVSNLTLQYEDKEKEYDELYKEKLKYMQLNEDYEEKLNQLQQNCNQLLKEAEVWNMRVNDLTVKLTEEMSAKGELETSLHSKDSEIETLTHLVQTFKSFEEFEETDENETKSNKDKLQSLMDSARLLIKLQKQEDENKMLSEKLSCEKNRILDMEVELMDSKSEIDKLKVNYNQALQDKAEAQTKLDVLTNYFKDKEIQLQKQLGVHEAVREKREKDADSAERRIILIEQENTSYKYQVASMKQEMEETERNLKSQIATQEKKAHENWIAARAAERKLEDMKQEVTQLRQRLTLLEREQEKWANSSRDEIIRPVPKRISGLNDESITTQDMNNSMDMPHMFPPPHHMMLPPDRPLPPLPPPPHLPPFLPPPPLEPHFRHQPWPPLPPDSMSGSEFRITPPDFSRGRESTPPRGHPSTLIDGEMGPRHSSPLGGEMRDSRNSTPPHSLPDFHDIPPPPRPFFPPPGVHPRYPLPPPFRRDMPQGSRRIENQGENGSRGSQQASENWPQSNSRV